MRATRLLPAPRSTPGAMWRARLRRFHEHRVELSAMGVTPIQAGVLLYLQRHPGSYRQRVADALGSDTAWTGLLIRALQHNGWVTRQRAPHHDSYVLLTLTQKGHALTRLILNRLKPMPFKKAS